LITPKRDFVFADKKPSQGQFNELLQKAAKQANRKGYQLYLYVKTRGCPASIMIDKNLDHPQLSQLFSQCYVLRLEIFDWMFDLFKRHLVSQKVPYFVRLTEQGKITDHQILGDWEEETPECAVAYLAAYFSDRNDKPPIEVSKQMLCEKLYWDLNTGDFEAVKRAVDETGCDPLRYQEDGSTYLHQVVTIRHKFATEAEIIEMAAYFIDKGVDIDKQNRLGATALSEALSQSHNALARLLIAHGADVNLQDEKGRYPLHHALSGSSADLETLDMLVERGAPLNRQDAWGSVPLHSTPFLEIRFAELLLESGAEINFADEKGDTPLHLLMNYLERHEDRLPHLKLYIERGADPSLVNNQGLSAAKMVGNYMSVQPHHSDILALLRGET
jgi:hypothetical protein